MNQPNLVDWFTLGVASLGTLLGTVTAVWTVVRGDKEHLDLHISWKWFGQHEKFPELPFLYIHNRSKNTVSIVDVYWYVGAIIRKEKRYTALFHEDPGDTNFPYEIAPGATSSLLLSDSDAISHFAECAKYSDFFGFFRRSSMWVGVTTMRGKKQFIGAERCLPWKSRPKWLRGSDED